MTTARIDALRYTIKTRLTVIRRAIKDRDLRAAIFFARIQARDGLELLALTGKETA